MEFLSRPRKALSSNCVVLVSNRRYLHRCMETVWQLRLFGRYFGRVVVIVGDDLGGRLRRAAGAFLGVRFVQFRELELSNHQKAIEGGAGLGGKELKKLFQYHKFWVFSEYFQCFDKVLYLDAGLRVMHPISDVLALDCSQKIIAHSDAYPRFETTLRDQFNLVDFPHLEEELERQVPMASDYFQTSMMLFDPSIGKSGAFSKLVGLLELFPNSKTNDQGIINLWALREKYWNPLPTYPIATRGRRFYDFYERDGLSADDYLMLKYPRGPLRRIDRVANICFRVYWKIFSLFWTRNV